MRKTLLSLLIIASINPCLAKYSGGSGNAYVYTDNGHGDLLEWSGSNSPKVTGNIYMPNVKLNVCELASTTISISGYVKTSQGARIKGVRITTSTGPNTVTDSLGKYSLTLNAPFTGTITPAQTDWTFSPTSIAYTNQTSDIIDQNFTSTYNVAYGGGSGTPSSPYLIYNAAQLNGIGARANDWDKYFRMMSDINLSAYDGKTGRPSFNRIGYYLNLMEDMPFTGTFDGGNHTISNFTFDSNAGNDCVGLFVHMSSNALIKNVNLKNIDINSTSRFGTGALVGHLYVGTVTECSVKNVSVRGDSYVGGLVGRCIAGVISDCNVSSAVSGKKMCGIIIGQNGHKVIDCSGTGNVNISDIQGGGLVGSNHGTISRCYSTATVLGSSGADQIGGLVGKNYGTISNCYAMGSTFGLTNIGGLVGLNSNFIGGGNVINSYSTGVSNGGGLIGVNTGGSITGSFWDINTSGNATSDGGMGKTTAEMQTLSTFTDAGWDFINESINGEEDIWYIPTGDYPCLCWQYGIKYGGGTGEPSDPYLIYTAWQMNKIGLDTNDWNKHFKLMDDIDLSAYTGQQFNIIGYGGSFSTRKPFTGIFDGNWHTISNFTYNNPGKGYAGIFGCITGRIKNLGLISPQITASEYVGTLVGLHGGVLICCWSDGGNVYGSSYTGGLVGSIGYDTHGGSIANCWSSATVNCENYAGGLVGKTQFEYVSNCYASGNVSGTNYVGGLVGANHDTFGGRYQNCYSSGQVTGANYVGGLVGYSDPNGTDAEGMFWDINTSGQIISALGKGKTTAQMQTMSTFINAGWDFVGELDNGPSDDWAEPNGGGYPVMWYELDPWPELPSFAAGSGTEGDPYEISTELELRSIGHNSRLMDKHFILTADLAMSDANFPIIGNSYYPFIGNFEGNNLTISNLNCRGGLLEFYAGLFGCAGDEKGASAKIANLNMEDVNIMWGYAGAGALAGQVWPGEVNNCHVNDGNVSGGYYVGGLIGGISRCDVSKCSTTGTQVSGYDQIGGLVGSVGLYASVRESSSSCSAEGHRNVGGLAGGVGLAEIYDSYSNSDVNATEESAGGFSGINTYGSFYRCYSSGMVTGVEKVGGFTGQGHHQDHYEGCFWDSDVNPDINGIGNVNDVNVVGKPTIEMQTQSTFTDAGWDFVGETANGTEDIWTIWEGHYYPRFAWEPSISGTFILDQNWMYQNLPGQNKSRITATLDYIDDPCENSSYTYHWSFELPDDVNVEPLTVAGGGINDNFWTFAAPGCNYSGGISNSGQTFKVKVVVEGIQHGNTGYAEREFAIALLGDVDNNKKVDVADRAIINAFWLTGAAGPFTLKDCDLNCNNSVSTDDRAIANAIWLGAIGRNSVSVKCPLR